jgi:hypothetical protein
MTIREVKVAEFEHFPVFFAANRELWEKVFSGQALTEDRKIRAKKSAGSPARDQSIPSTSVLSRRYLPDVAIGPLGDFIDHFRMRRGGLGGRAGTTVS